MLLLGVLLALEVSTVGNRWTAGVVVLIGISAGGLRMSAVQLDKFSSPGTCVESLFLRRDCVKWRPYFYFVYIFSCFRRVLFLAYFFFSKLPSEFSIVIFLLCLCGEVCDRQLSGVRGGAGARRRRRPAADPGFVFAIYPRPAEDRGGRSLLLLPPWSEHSIRAIYRQTLTPLLFFYATHLPLEVNPEK